MSHQFNNDDLQAFLIEAELVNQKVKALANNQLAPEEFDRLQALRAQDLSRRQQAKKRKQVQKMQKRKQGMSGKGITKDFASFCRHCHWQYQFATPTCLRCNKPTMELAQRQKQLQFMVEEYKDKKKKREERKMKWNMWQKTKSMLWRKTSNFYDKWEYFVSDSQEQAEQQPIVPKNDPNFMALEKDIVDRKNQRKKDNQNAKRLKQKGNIQMKNGNYGKAIQFYHLALQHVKDLKSIYTNRALAYIKLGKYDKAIKDCDNIIQYVQVFGKANQSQDLLFKAYLRRASALKEKKQYVRAKQDIIKAQQIYPKDESCRILKNQLESFIEHTEKVAKILRTNKQQNQKETEVVAKVENQTVQIAEATEQQIQEKQRQIVRQLAEEQMDQQKTEQIKNKDAEDIDNNEKQVISQQKPEQKKQQIQQKNSAQKPNNNISSNMKPLQRIKSILQQNSLSQIDIQQLFRMIKGSDQNLTIFLAAKGIKKCLTQLTQADQTKKQGYLVSCCLRGDGVAEQQVWEYGIEKIHDKIIDILKIPSQMNMNLYFLLEDLFEVLIPLSLHEKYRPLIAGSESTFKFFEITFSRLITRHKKQPDLLSSFLIYAGNICSGNSKLRDQYITSEILYLLISSLHEKILIRKTTNRGYLNLKKNVYGFYANLVINQSHRKTFCKYYSQVQQQKQIKMQRWEQLIKQVKTYPKSEQNFKQYMESLLSVFTNVTLGTHIVIPSLVQCLNTRFLQNPQLYSAETINRSLLILIRLRYTDLEQFSKMMKNLKNNLSRLCETKQAKIMEQVVRLLNTIYMPIQIKCQQQSKKIVFTESLPTNMLQQLKKYISCLDYGEVLFCNTCNLFSAIIGSGSMNQAANRNKQTILKHLKPIMKFLIEVAKEKIGNWRKNASILLAKMSLDQSCRQQLNRNHGMDVLRSIAHYVKQK